jgi:hypothetical protein
VSLAEALAIVSDTNVVQVLDRWATMRRGVVEPLLLKGLRLAKSFGLGYPST